MERLHDGFDGYTALYAETDEVLGQTVIKWNFAFLTVVTFWTEANTSLPFVRCQIAQSGVFRL